MCALREHRRIGVDAWEMISRLMTMRAIVPVRTLHDKGQRIP